MANVNPVQIEKFLKGIKYPATKMELISCAERNGADNQVREMLERLPEQKYEQSTDVSKAISSIERRGAH
jgi:Protein of unknown function (DUF2795)